MNAYDYNPSVYKFGAPPNTPFRQPSLAPIANHATSMQPQLRPSSRELYEAQVHPCECCTSTHSLSCTHSSQDEQQHNFHLQSGLRHTQEAHDIDNRPPSCSLNYGASSDLCSQSQMTRHLEPHYGAVMSRDSVVPDSGEHRQLLSSPRPLSAVSELEHHMGRNTGEDLATGEEHTNSLLSQCGFTPETRPEYLARRRDITAIATHIEHGSDLRRPWGNHTRQEQTSMITAVLAHLKKHNWGYDIPLVNEILKDICKNMGRYDRNQHNKSLRATGSAPKRGRPRR